MTNEDIKRTTNSLGKTRGLLSDEIVKAYDDENWVLLAILRDARRVLEEGIDELSGVGKTNYWELSFIPNNTEDSAYNWWTSAFIKKV